MVFAFYGNGSREPMAEGVQANGVRLVRINVGGTQFGLGSSLRPSR